MFYDYEICCFNWHLNPGSKIKSIKLVVAVSCASRLFHSSVIPFHLNL